MNSKGTGGTYHLDCFLDIYLLLLALKCHLPGENFPLKKKQLPDSADGIAGTASNVMLPLGTLSLRVGTCAVYVCIKCRWLHPRQCEAEPSESAFCSHPY